MSPVPKFFFLALLFLLLSSLPLAVSESDGQLDLESEVNPGSNSITSPMVDDFLVNDDTGSSDQEYPAMATGPENFVICWQDNRSGNWDIYAQRYNLTGTPQGPNFKINDDTGNVIQYDPAVVMDCFGNFMVIWTDKRNGFYDTYAQRFNSSGTPLGSNFKLPSQYGRAIASDCFGNFILAWEGSGIYAQRYSSAGTPLDTVFKVNDDVELPWGSSHLWPAVSMSPGGDFVIIWADNRHIYPFNIFAQRYDYQGHPLGSNFQVNDNTCCNLMAYTVSMDIRGNFVIAWPDQRNYTGVYVYDIYAQRYDSFGSPSGSNFKVNDDTSPSNRADPSIAMDFYNNFIITWQDERNGNPDVYAQRFDSLGNPVGKNYLVPNRQYASFVQIGPAVTAANSNVFFAWTDNRRGKGYDIYAKIVDWNWTKVVEDENLAIPNSFELSQNYPNPFNPTTRIQFRVGSLEFGDPLNTTLKIYNILGQLVRTLVNEEKAPGNYNVVWDGKDDSGKEVSSGIYFYQLKTPDYTTTKKMVLLR